VDLIPKPDQVVSAAGNLAQGVLWGGLADLRPMPRTIVDQGPHHELFHFQPATTRTSGDPVLLVMPLAAPPSCYDLRRGCSLAQHLVAGGRPTYLVDHGQVSLKDRSLGLDRWVDDVVPAAVRETSEQAGGRPVHLVGWSLGGIFALLAAAGHQDLPIASITVLGSPVDTTRVPLVAPARPLLQAAPSHRPATTASRVLGAATSPLLRWASQVGPVDRVLGTPLALATHLDDAEFLAQVEAVGRFTAAMSAYPGRTYGQVYHRFLPGNALADGSLEVAGRTVDLADVTVPVLVVAGATDTIAPVAAVQAVVPLLTGSPDVRLEIVTGGHLGLLTGRGARDTTWVTLDEWVEEFSDTTSDTASDTAFDTASDGDGPAIGANPSRRYGSQGSRDLSR
jgi:polyhydroxyalkanoate synthase